MEDCTNELVLNINLDLIANYCSLESMKNLRLINKRVEGKVTPLLNNTIRIQNYSDSKPDNIEERLLRYEFQANYVKNLVIRGEYNTIELDTILNKFKAIEYLELNNFKLKAHPNNGSNWLTSVLSLKYLNTFIVEACELPQTSYYLDNTIKDLELEELRIKNLPLDCIPTLVKLISQALHIYKLAIDSELLSATLLQFGQTTPSSLLQLSQITDLDLIATPGSKPIYNMLFPLFKKLKKLRLVDCINDGEVFYYLPQTLKHFEFNSIELPLDAFYYFIKNNQQLEGLVIKQGTFLNRDSFESILKHLPNLKTLEIDSFPLSFKLASGVLSEYGTQLQALSLNFRFFDNSKGIDFNYWKCYKTLRYLTLTNFSFNNEESSLITYNLNRIQIEINNIKLN